MIDTICGSEIGQIGVKISKLNFDTELYESNTTTCCAVYSLKRSTARAAAARRAGLPGGRGRDSAWNVTAATEATGAATAVTGGEERVEAEAGDEDRQEGETQPPLAQLPVTVITGTDILV